MLFSQLIRVRVEENVKKSKENLLDIKKMIKDEITSLLVKKKLTKTIKAFMKKKQS